MKTDIQNKVDIRKLVDNFYTHIRDEPTIGHFFNENIKDWDAHLEILTSFWEANLFPFEPKTYSGNPIAVHRDVDKKMNHSIEQEHFGIWLRLWVNTVDSLFEGEIATKAKLKARKMATFMFIRIFEAR